MDKIFDYAAHIRTPLSLAGIFAAILFYILLQILKKENSGYKKKEIQIVNKLFILALISMLLGFSGWTIQLFKKKSPTPTLLKFNVYVRNRPVEGIAVRADNIGGSGTSNIYGLVTLVSEVDSLPDSLHLTFSFNSEQWKIDTVITVPAKNYPPRFNLIQEMIAKAPKSPVSPPIIVNYPATGNYGIKIYSNTIHCLQEMGESDFIVSSLTKFACTTYYFRYNNEYHSEVIIVGFASIHDANTFGSHNRVKIKNIVNTLYLRGNRDEWEIIDLSKEIDNRIQPDNINKGDLHSCDNYPAG